jgi:allantoinase
MLDVLLTQGKVVTAGVVTELDVGIQNGKIYATYGHGGAPEAKRTLNCQGSLILPGFIDTHFHCRAPARPDRETWASATKAAAAGGVTTILEMPSSTPVASTPEVIRCRRESSVGECYVDFGLYGGGASGDGEIIAGLVEEGVIGFKVFMHSPPPGHGSGSQGLYTTSNGELYKALRAISAAGGDLPCAVHAEDESLIETLTTELKAADRHDPLAHLESRPPFVEAAAVATLLVLAEELGLRLHLPHVSSGWAMRLAREAKRRAAKLSVETCPHYLLCDDKDMERLGSFAKINPPLRPAKDVAALWDALRDGTVDTVGSDHGPYRPEEKAEPDIWRTPAGHPGVEVLGHAMLSEALGGRIPLPRAVEVLAEAPARIFSLWPTKGCIAAGADADLVVYDPRIVWTFRKENSFSLAGDNYRLWHGRQFRGKVVRTLVRGETVYLDGQIVGKAGHGSMVRPSRATTQSGVVC